jgi:hypothetical protein
MGRLTFDSSGRLASIEGVSVEKEKEKEKKKEKPIIDISEKEDYSRYKEKFEIMNKERNASGFNNAAPTTHFSQKRSDFYDDDNFGLLLHEKIERVGWANKKSNNYHKNKWESNSYKSNNSKMDYLDDFEEDSGPNEPLRKEESLSFLRDSKVDPADYNVEQIKNKYWNFYSNGKYLDPLKFSNNKTQEDVVKEVVKLIKQGEKIIFLHGVCGSGKSAIALNISRALGKSAIVVPLKSLQRQYEDDYSSKKYLIKEDFSKLKIASITGKDNHDSIYMLGKSCADKNLPENIKITEKNMQEVIRYYGMNEFNDDNDSPEITSIKRMHIAPANPYWSPILPGEIKIKSLEKAKKYKYKGCDGREFIFYHRKSGCSYYDQYLAYVYADVLIYNSAKYKSELLLSKKPATEVDIIDEADEFLDNLFNQKEINLKRLYDSLVELSPQSDKATELKAKILRLLEIEFKNNNFFPQENPAQETSEEDIMVTDVDIKKINNTNLLGILKILLANNDLVSEISMEELNYANTVIEIAKSFTETIESLYLSYKIAKGNLIASLVTSDISGCVNEIINKNNAMVFMSGTVHSEEIIKNILGIKNYKIVEAETKNLGTIEIIRTGKEFNCQYSTFSQKDFSREDYLFSLSDCITKAKLPALIHVNAFKDLPSETEISETGINNLISREELIDKQRSDKLGEEIRRFKNKEISKLFTTKCSRGIDFPGDMCNSVLFTKYPNPNVNDMFWKILKKTHPKSFWQFYTDKARREFLQRIYRAIRSVDDHIYVLSPDMRVIEAVQKIQRGEL